MERGRMIADDVRALLRARNPLIWIVTREEARVEGYLFEAAAAAGYVANTWDVGQGARSIGGQSLGRETADPGAMFEMIRSTGR